MCRTITTITTFILLLPSLGCSNDSKRAKEAFGRGNEAIDKKEYDKAIAEFTEVIRLDPRYDLAGLTAVPQAVML